MEATVVSVVMPSAFQERRNRTGKGPDNGVTHGFYHQGKLHSEASPPGKMEAEEEMELVFLYIRHGHKAERESLEAQRALSESLGSCFRANRRKQLLSMVGRRAGGPWASRCPARGVRQPRLPVLAPAV